LEGGVSKPLDDLAALVASLRASGIAQYTGPVPGEAWDLVGPGRGKPVTLVLGTMPVEPTPDVVEAVAPPKPRDPMSKLDDIEARLFDARLMVKDA
jgi:hypothetical protein